MSRFHLATVMSYPESDMRPRFSPAPTSLLLSGVGPKADLTALGIKSVVDLPGVGQNLQDHGATSMSWAVEGMTWSNLGSDVDLAATQLAQWRQNGTGMWSYVNEAVGEFPSPKGNCPSIRLILIISVSFQISLPEYPRLDDGWRHQLD